MNVTQVQVSDLMSGKRLSGVSVTFKSPSGEILVHVTDAEGHACFGLNELGDYKIHAQLATYPDFNVITAINFKNSRFELTLCHCNSNTYGNFDLGAVVPCTPTEAKLPDGCAYFTLTMKLNTPIGEIQLIKVNTIFPKSVDVTLLGITYTLLQDIELIIPLGTLKASSISPFGAIVCVTVATLPGGGGGGGGDGGLPPGDTGDMPPPPVLEICVFPTLSLNLIAVLADLAKWIMCTILNILKQLIWFGQVIVYLVPKIVEFLVYVVTLKWIVDGVKGFFDALDVWVSVKFGIDPDLPFWDELVKKTLKWIADIIDAAANNRILIRKW